MSKTINELKLIRALEKEQHQAAPKANADEYANGFYNALSFAVRTAQKLAEPCQVERSRWIRRNNTEYNPEHKATGAPSLSWYREIYICEECGARAAEYGQQAARFCPTCGRFMLDPEYSRQKIHEQTKGGRS